MGDEYDAAEAAYWESEAAYEDEAELHRAYGTGIPREHYSMMPEISVKRGGIQFPTRAQAIDLVKTFKTNYPSFTEYARSKTEETKVQNDQDLLTQAEELRDQATKLERIVAEREKYGDDPFKNGTVLKVDMRYRTGSRRSFAYGVVKVAGKFYLSGKLSAANAGAGMDWDAFVAWLSQGDATVWQAKSLQQVF